MNFESPDNSLIVCESFSEIEIKKYNNPGASFYLESNASEIILIDEDDLPSISTKKIQLLI
jgi:hypothetical protein